MKEIELLAPAGDFERLKIAFHYGADAVYFGGKDYGLRANAQNFGLEEIKEAATYAHRLGKRVFVTVNIVFHDKDIIGLETYLKELDKAHIDAIILSDPLVLEVAKQANVSYELHLSTQVSTLNYESVRFWKNEGISRVVLAREASREDILRIKKETGMELEAFIHGAMCTSFSGRCVLSNYCTNRDSNRGGCAQICRWAFQIDESLPDYSMTPKDLNMVPYIEDMILSGVNSFKVEGRMRSIYYVATVIYVYRSIIDNIRTKTLTPAYIDYYLHILNRCANRDSTPQFYDKLPTETEQYFLERQELSNQDFLGIVLSYDKEENIVVLEQRNHFKVGDVVEFFGPNTKEVTYTVCEMWDEHNRPIEVAPHAQMIVKLPISVPLEALDMMRVKVFDKPQ